MTRFAPSNPTRFHSSDSTSRHATKHAVDLEAARVSSPRVLRGNGRREAALVHDLGGSLIIAFVECIWRDALECDGKILVSAEHLESAEGTLLPNGKLLDGIELVTINRLLVNGHDDIANGKLSALLSRKLT